MAMDSKEARTIWGEIVAKAWEDDEYRNAFLNNPRKVLEEAGLELSQGVNIVPLEDTPELRHVILPYDTPFATYKDTVVSLLEKVLPLPKGLRIEIVQNTADTRYMNLPPKPAGFTASGELTDEELALVVGGKSKNVSETDMVIVNYGMFVAAAYSTVLGVVVLI